MGNGTAKLNYFSQESFIEMLIQESISMIESEAKKQLNKIVGIVEKIGEVDYIAMLESVLYKDIKRVDFSDIGGLDTYEKRIIYYECIKRELGNYLFFNPEIKCGVEEEVIEAFNYIDRHLYSFVCNEKENLITIGLLKKCCVIGENTIKVRNLLDPTFFEMCLRYAQNKISGYFFYDFLEQFNEIVRERIIEVYSYFEKWGNYRPQETTAANLKEYYEVLPRFELSAIYKEAERVEQEKAPKEIKTDTLDYPKGKTTKSIYFGYNYSREQLNRVFDVLKERGYVESREKDNFYKVFTSRDYNELKDIRIVWLRDVTYLPILIRELADNIENDEDKSIWVLAKLYFIKANGKEFDCENMKADASKSKQDDSSSYKTKFKNEILEAIKNSCK